MFMHKHKVIGVLGGMGPAATMDLYARILRLTAANSEQDHISTLIFSNPKIPDRTTSYSKKESGAVIRYLQETAKVLEDGGADIIVIPCNSAHIYYDAICSVITVDVINMIQETVDCISDNVPHQSRVALLGTTATYESGEYQRALARAEIHTLLPDPADRKIIMRAIYDIKRDTNSHSARALLQSIASKWQVPVILGCSEISMVMPNTSMQSNFINPIEILAKAAICAVSTSTDGTEKLTAAGRQWRNECAQ
jgi:aspartate racemase